MAKIIALANQKGGVAKTTTAVNLAAALSAMKRRILLIDLDPQGNATVGSGVDKTLLMHSVNAVLMSEVTVDQVIQKTSWGYDLLPSNGDLTVAEVRLVGKPNNQQKLKQTLEPIRDNYDFVLIDCPPSLNTLTLNALVAADSVLVPIQCEYYALEGLTSLLGTIDQIRKAANPSLKVEGLLRTMYDGRNRLSQEVSAQLFNHFPGQVYLTVIPRNVRLAEAPSHGKPVMHYDETSQGAVTYLALAGEICRRQQEANAISALTAVIAGE